MVELHADEQVTWAVVDVETTGLHPARDRIVEVAVVRLDADAEPVDEWSTLIHPGTSSFGSRIHGITAAGLASAPTFREVVEDLLARFSARVIVAHNAPFDVAFLQAETVRAGIAWGPIEGLCTMEVLHGLGVTKSRKLVLCCSELGLPAGRDHVALEDARAAARLLGYLRPRLWAIETPSPAPTWPKPSIAAPVHQRTSGVAHDVALDLTRHFRIPANLAIASPAASTYLALLDQVLEDGRITENEVEALGLFAHACGITRDIARQLHLAYLEEMSRLVMADGVVTDDEREYLANLMPLLTEALPR